MAGSERISYLALYFLGGDMPYVYVTPRNYGCLSFLGDCIMVFLTCGLWLIWIFVREMRRRRSFYI